MVCNGEDPKKTGKREKKCKIISVGPPFFCQNGPDFPSKTGLGRTHRLQVADFQHLSVRENQGTPFPDLNKSNFNDDLTKFI
jgi:hypothetical protein